MLLSSALDEVEIRRWWRPCFKPFANRNPRQQLARASLATLQVRLNAATLRRVAILTQESDYRLLFFSIGAVGHWVLHLTPPLLYSLSRLIRLTLASSYSRYHSLMGMILVVSRYALQGSAQFCSNIGLSLS